MKSCSTNDVKIYNLSAGKALPEWLSEKKKRSTKKLQGRRQLELIQDFDMPGLSTNIKITPDGEYILATGIYKPRLRCYDVKNLSMKFERCFDSEVVKFLVLSEDYSKLVFLQCDRFIEFHVQYGRYYRMRIPKFGRDLAYHTPSCDLYVVGASSEVYRLNLELGRFNTPLQTDVKCINVCKVNPVHHLVTFGTVDGRVEAWDPRSGSRCGNLDVAMHAATELTEITGLPAVTSLNYKDGLKLGVGTSTGQVLLYDIRSSKPLLVKDHYYSQPILNIEFHKEEDLVLSMDSKIVKIWHEEDGKPFTAVEGGETDFNDLCVVPGTGMFFVANEDRKILSYFVPSLGPAPKWCSSVDTITEELEETDIQTVYDDYKFVTEREINDLGLDHLIGTNLLRGYMHGYFIDMRLYRKAKSAIQPFQFDEFKKKKIREKLQEQRKSRVKLNNLPQVNKELALKIMAEPAKVTNKKSGNLLQDDRFKDIFVNPDFQIDKSADEYRLLNPVLSSMEKKRTKRLEAVFSAVKEDEEMEGKGSSEEEDSSSDDDDRSWVKEVRQERYKIKNEERIRQMEEDSIARIQPKFYEIKPGEDFKLSDIHANGPTRHTKVSLGERVQRENLSEIKSRGPLGSREMTFSMKSRRIDNSREEAFKHRQERQQLRRSAGGLKNKRNSWKR